MTGDEQNAPRPTTPPDPAAHHSSPIARHPMPRVLRGLSVSAHAFAALGEGGEVAPPTFRPLPDLTDPAAPPAPSPGGAGGAAAPDAGAVEAAREAGRRERDDEVAALQAEVDRLTAEHAGADAQARTQAERFEAAVERLASLWEEAARALEPALSALAVEAAEAVLAAPALRRPARRRRPRARRGRRRRRWGRARDRRAPPGRPPARPGVRARRAPVAGPPRPPVGAPTARSPRATGPSRRPRPPSTA